MSKKQEKNLKNFKEPGQQPSKKSKNQGKPVKNIKKRAKVANSPKMSKNRENPVKNIEKLSKMLKNH